MKTIYTASKVKHAHKWIALRERGYSIISTWIDEARDKESPSLPDLWLRCVDESATCTAFLLYIEDGDVLKGALVEVGAALAYGVPVYIVGTPDGSWAAHPLIIQCNDLTDALRRIHSDSIKQETTVCKS